MKYYISLGMRLFVSLMAVWFMGLYSFIILDISAYLSYLPLKLLYNANIADNVIYLGEKSIEYVEACGAVGAYVFLGLLILLTRNINFKKGLKMFFIGAILILFANIIRIDILAYLLIKNDINMFITLHLFTWKILSGVYVALVWIFLVKMYDIKEIPLWSDFKHLKKKLS